MARWNADVLRRRGFTLVELLTVIAILGILGAMVVAAMPKIQEKQRSASGASSLQGWLGVAKNWARRDNAPRGLRLTATGVPVNTAYYIEQPEDWSGAATSTVSTASSGTTTTATLVPPATASAVDFSGGFGVPYDDATWPVRINDYIEFYSGANAKLVRITSVGVSSAGTPDAKCLQFTTPTGWTEIASTTDFRIVRQARPRVGEAALELPYNVVIDLNTNAAYGNTLPINGTNVDIMFAPGGNVIGGNTDIRLWVRDTTFPASGNTFGGEQFLVNVAVRTGLISVHPVDVTPGGAGYVNPYSFTQDGHSSGF